ncbi:MAG: hypothetical protein QOF02_679 [Blastocatellia bacterium]|nr:hypothetical protein [Blastocatellia bacterium]
MIERAFILGQIGKAVYEQDDRYYVLGLGDSPEPVECRAGEVAFFFDVSREYSVISGGDISSATIRETLEFSRQAHGALTMMLSGLNQELSPESRRLSVEAAEELLQDGAALAFVRARLLARLLPETADMDGALVYAANAGALTVFALYEEVGQSQEAIKFILEAWSEVATEFFLDAPEQAAGAEKILIESGVFAEMATAATAGETSRLGSIVATYGMKIELRRALPPPRSTQIINAVRMKLQERVNAAPIKAAHIRRDEMKADSETAEFESVEVEQPAAQATAALRKLIAAFDKRNRDWRPSKGYQVEERINHQIEAIGKLISKGDLERAREFLRGLLEFHLEHSRKEHTAMSLCALAKAAMDANAFETADELVSYAFALNVEDAVIWTTRAEILKATGQIDAALEVYEQTVQSFPDDVVARNGYAEALKAKGNFDAALEAYEETMRRFPNNVVARTGYADTLKAKGDFNAALEAYEEAMRRFPGNVVARSGYAEALKAKGDFDAALEAYEEAMRRFPGNVVARTGYADTLKAKGDFNAALEAYEETMRRFPDDVVARNGCASLLVIMKNFDEAESLLSYLSGIQPVTKNHWIGHHILGMLSLRRGETDEAIRRLEYGWKNTPWSDDRNYFATALGLARMRRKEFGPAIEMLVDNVVSLDVFQRQKRFAFIGHSQAALGLKDEAVDTLAQVTNIGGPLVLDLKGNLIRCFGLDPRNPQNLTAAEIAGLERKIDDEEEQLVMLMAA